MIGLIEVPIPALTALLPEGATKLIRSVLRAECRYGQVGPNALTVSSRISVADGGIDVEVNTDPAHVIPRDCLFQSGLTGFQIKSGTTFKPWTKSAIHSELLNSNGELVSEVERLLGRRGNYTLICTGHDLTPSQRDKAKAHIELTFASAGFKDYLNLVHVLGASQIAEFVERYPAIASTIVQDPIQEASVLADWQQSVHMSGVLAASAEQTELIDQIRASVLGTTKHLRILGEPGLGKTRLVLEALRTSAIAPLVLYFEHGSQFGQTKLFRQLLKSPCDKPLVLVIDELPEPELADIWKHLKPRCGALKIVTLDHGRDETRDADIERLYVPRLSDETILQILVGYAGESNYLSRWVEGCEGSPRVAQAIGENLRVNPEDLLVPPSTIPVWDRFLHSYQKRDQQQARQIDCVTQHLALFNRFGYEPPVGDEARYIATLIEKVDPTIGWAQFQEIVRDLRARRVLQGSITLFFVPKLLHVYLWKRFWQTYGPGFQFSNTFTDMPESLHVWFMNMFRYAGDSTTTHVVDEILKLDGIHSERAILESDKGSRFLSTLAEASPGAVIRLLEGTLGSWSDEDIFAFHEHRQNIVWTVEKIAVWAPFTVRAIRLLARLAVNESEDTYSNNATGTLIGLFRIGPEYAATESTPIERLPAALQLLRSSSDKDRELGLRCMNAALDTHGLGHRIVGPEYQGIKERAKLWIPKTYVEWWEAIGLYFEALLAETRGWPVHLRPLVCSALLDAIKNQVKTKSCTSLALNTLQALTQDPHASASELNDFFSNWRDRHSEGESEEITKKVVTLGRAYVHRDVRSRFQRYVIDVDWMEWDEDFRERRGKPRYRTKPLVNTLAKRIANHHDFFDAIWPMLAPQKQTPAMWHFGEQLGLHDKERSYLSKLVAIGLHEKHWGCLGGYLSQIRREDLSQFQLIIENLLARSDEAWLGAEMTFRFDYDDLLFSKCLSAFKSGWIKPGQFSALRYGRAWEAVPNSRMKDLLQQLHAQNDAASLSVLVELLDAVPFEESSPFTSKMVFDVLTRSLPSGEDRNVMRGHHWKNICEKLVKWDADFVLPLLSSILTAMGNEYRLSYDTYVETFASDLVRKDPIGAWRIVREQLEAALPKWRGDLTNWLKGGHQGFREAVLDSPIAALPVGEIMSWIEGDPEHRAGLIAHAAPRTLDDERGGLLTRELLTRFSAIDGVQSGISCTFGSGGWTGPTSVYLKKRRDKFRTWVSANFSYEVTRWLESEIDSLDRQIKREEIDEERTRYE
ncbi:MAG: hypothetical protein ABI790_03755 [Betaproteobacteria bacterium]